MISICIPIHNCSVEKLTHDLKNQADNLDVEYEILLYDDGSDISYREMNRPLSDLSNVVYKELQKNIGRSAIRNMLAKEAQFKYLIFMDCDAQVCCPDFIAKYIQYCQPGIVCYGGRKNLSESPSSEYFLRWYLSVRREETSADIRNRKPNKNFLTFNFLIDKEIFEQNSFDESLTGYGHEDTLFGIKLVEHNIKIHHIDNPLIHAELDTAKVFIEKTEQSIQNLVEIQKRIGSEHNFTKEVKLLNAEKRIISLRLTSLLSYSYKVTRKLMLRNLLGKKPTLFIFDLYKLGYLCTLRNEQNKKQ